MSVEALMVHTVTLKAPSGVTRNAIGEAFATFDTLQTTMYLEPTRGSTQAFAAGREDRADRNTPVGDWLGLGRLDVDWHSWQQIVYGAHTFDIIAPPRVMPNPRLGTLSHVELSLQEVDGTGYTAPATGAFDDSYDQGDFA